LIEDNGLILANNRLITRRPDGEDQNELLGAIDLILATPKIVHRVIG
jgi:hypothetical protein